MTSRTRHPLEQGSNSHLRSEAAKSARRKGTNDSVKIHGAADDGDNTSDSYRNEFLSNEQETSSMVIEDTNSIRPRAARSRKSSQSLSKSHHGPTSPTSPIPPTKRVPEEQQQNKRAQEEQFNAKSGKRHSKAQLGASPNKDPQNDGRPPENASPIVSPRTTDLGNPTRVYDPRTHIFRPKQHSHQAHGHQSHPRPQSHSYVVPSNKNVLSSESDQHQSSASHSQLESSTEAMLLQPETRPISQEQLVNEVKGIYAGLVMVEKKCVEIDNQQAQPQADGRQSKLSNEQWQALIALHRTLLHEHHDFFLASQHPSASPALRRLAAKYAMPARMWRHGIHSFLELLRHRLPDSLDHMLAFIYLAYSMMALLKESVPAFEDTWIECLGDLARYRMAIEDEDLRDREVWSGVARYWYNKAADKSPRIGRIQHHLAVLARPHALLQLFYYTRALDCVQPFQNAKESILTLFNPFLEDSETVVQRSMPIDIAFIKAHAIHFKKGPMQEFDENTAKFLSTLDNNIGRITAKWREQGVWIASANFFAVLNSLFGAETLLATLNKILPDSPRSYDEARDIWNTISQDSTDAMEIDSLETTLETSSNELIGACCLTFSTFSIALQRIGDKNVLPHVHVTLTFLLCVSLVPEVMRHLEPFVPWTLVASFLNQNQPSFKQSREFKQNPFPKTGAVTYLPEDFAMRGQVWAQQYHPSEYFDDCPVDDEERSLELPSMAGPRLDRCVYLGQKIASLERCLRYDSSTNTFGLTPLARDLEKGDQARLICRSRSRTLSIEQEVADVEMIQEK